MASNALQTQGVVLQRGNGATPEIFSAIAEIMTFDGPGGSAAEIDVTSLSSSAKEFLLGLKDEGEFDFTANLIPSDTGQVGLRTDRDNRTRRNFRLLLTDAGPTTLSFTAIVKEFSIKGKVDDAIRLSIKLRVTGPVTWQ
jgi:predicted secreted protein